MGYIDSHMHATDERWTDLSQSLKRAREKGITDFVMGGVSPDEWEKQKLISQKEEGLHCVFGLHPYFVAANELSECENALDLLSKNLKHSKALGETGLDYRKAIGQGTEDRQLQIMEAQVELAVVRDLPVVFHIVRAFDNFSRYLEWAAPKSLRGFVHAFNGPWEHAYTYIRKGLLISVGGALCWDKNNKLKESVVKIPMEFLLIESDSPDQPPESRKGMLNEPETIWEVAHEVARLKGLQTEEVLDRSSQNLRKLLSL